MVQCRVCDSERCAGCPFTFVPRHPCFQGAVKNIISVKKSPVIAYQFILTVEKEIIEPNASRHQRGARVPAHPIDLARLNLRRGMITFVVERCLASPVIAAVGR